MIAGHGRETILPVPAQPILAVLGHYSLNLDGARSQNKYAYAVMVKTGSSLRQLQQIQPLPGRLYS